MRAKGESLWYWVGNTTSYVEEHRFAYVKMAPLIRNMAYSISLFVFPVLVLPSLQNYDAIFSSKNLWKVSNFYVFKLVPNFMMYRKKLWNSMSLWYCWDKNTERNKKATGVIVTPTFLFMAIILFFQYFEK